MDGVEGANLRRIERPCNCHDRSIDIELGDLGKDNFNLVAQVRAYATDCPSHLDVDNDGRDETPAPLEIASQRLGLGLWKRELHYRRAVHVQHPSLALVRAGPDDFVNERLRAWRRGTWPVVLQELVGSPFGGVALPSAIILSRMLFPVGFTATSCATGCPRSVMMTVSPACARRMYLLACWRSSRMPMLMVMCPHVAHHARSCSNALASWRGVLVRSHGPRAPSMGLRGLAAPTSHKR